VARRVNSQVFFKAPHGWSFAGQRLWTLGLSFRVRLNCSTSRNGWPEGGNLSSNEQSVSNRHVLEDTFVSLSVGEAIKS